VAKKRKPTHKTKKPARREKDVRGTIVESVERDEYGPVFSKGHLEGRDSWSEVPQHIKDSLRTILKSGKAKISIRRINPPEDQEP